MAKKIKQQVNFSCKPSELFNIILDSKLHTKVTGAKASVSKKETEKMISKILYFIIFLNST
jgi:hypothetical protein